MALALSMVVGMLSGCGLGHDTASDVVVVQDSVTEVNEISLSSMDQDTFLLSAGETPQLKFETANGIVTDITVTPDDTTLQPYQYYTVTFTLTANENESFTKTASITLNGVELKVKKWAKDQLIIEYTTLALPETVTTDEMAKVTSYGDAASESSLGTAKVQALLDSDLTLYSEDGKESYTVQKGYVPLFMVPSFVANGEPEQIKDGERVQIIKEHGEEDFPGAAGEWYRIAYRGKVGYLPGTFVKDAKVQVSSEDKGKTSETTKPTNNTAQTRPAVKPSAGQNNQMTAQNAGNNSTNSSGSSSESSENNSGSNSSGGSGSTSGSNSGSNSGSDSGNIDKTVYYQIDFDLGGGVSSKDAMLPKAMMVVKDSTIDINQLATPSVPGYLFEAWYYDAALTRQVCTGDRINSNLTLYAKVTEITADMDVAQGQDSYLSQIDVNAKDFAITVLKPTEADSTDSDTNVASLHNLADQDTSLSFNIAKQNTPFTTDGKVYDKYTITFSALEQGETYQLQLVNSDYVFCEDDEIQPAAVRLYNFTTQMTADENLSLNQNLVYLQEKEVSYTEGSDYLSGLFTVNVNDDMTKLNTVDGSGSFTYNGNQQIKVGTTVVIYDGAEAPKLGEGGLKSAEQYNGNAAYVTISKIVGNTYYYGVAEAEDVLFTPDVLPVNKKDDQDTAPDTITIATEKLHFSGSAYREMNLDENTTVDVGDYLAIYEGSLDADTQPTYGRITNITPSDGGQNTILTYTEVTEVEVLDSMTVYSTEEMDIELDDATAHSIEQEIEQQAIDSGFAVEAANYLATVALGTEELQSLTGDMGLQTMSLTTQTGAVVPQSEISLFAASNRVSVGKPSVVANISRNLQHLTGGSNGVRAQLEVSFDVTMGSGDNKLILKVAATFEQEIVLNLNIKGKAVWGKKWIFPYIKDYRITTNLDAGSYTGISITATIQAEGEKPEFDWSEVAGNDLGAKIKTLMEQQDKFFNQDIGSTGGGLAEKYAEMLENNPDWIDLVNKNIFSNEARILAGIIVVGVQGDFVVSAKVNIMLGMSFHYQVYKRYTFTLNVFSKSSSSNCVDLKKSEYQFDMYVMGTLGIRAGIRLTVYAGLFSKKVAAIGITAETGAYIQMWGYFYYSTSWQAGSGKSSSASGAMLLEVGAYLEIRFLATAFGGRFQYAPVLYDKYWPLWNLGSAENVYGFHYETTAGEADAKDIDMGAGTSVALPVDRMNMSYMNLRSGDTADKDYTYSDFDITTTGNFKYENGVISVIPQDGSYTEKGTIKLTWKGAPLSFTSNPLSVVLDITWSDPSRIHSVSYELHGGTAYEGEKPLADGIPTVKAITGAKITAPSTVVKKQYYVFDGWYQDAEGTIPWKFDTDQVTGDLVLHAKWKPESYEITYELDGGTNDEKNPVTYTIEDTVKLENPVKPGYQFLGWNTEQDGTGTTVTEIPAGSSGAKTFYARWTPLEQSYEIHHMLQTLDGSDYVDTDTVTEKAYTGTEVTIGDAQSKSYAGFTFDASKTDDSKGTIPGEGTLVLKLYYNRNNYAVTFVSGTDDTIGAQNIAYEGKVTKPSELTKAGYQFTGWYLTGDPSRLWNFDNDVVTGTTELRAGWSALTYNVTLDGQGGAGGHENVQATYDSGMPTITLPARAGYQFAGYYDQTEGGTQYYNADGSSAKTWDKPEDSTLYAHWTANSYQVTFDANGGEGSMNAEDFTYGEAKALTQNSFTKTGYNFAGWATTANAGEAEHEDGKNVSNLTTEQNGTVNLYAVWKPIAYMVSFSGNGNDGGSMEDQTFRYDTAASLRGNGYTRTGYHFLGWAKTAGEQVTYTDGASVNNLTATADDRITLYAVWEANTYTVRFNANGGTGDQMASQSFTYDEAVKALSKNTYTRDNYTFLGWARTRNATTPEYTDQQKVNNLVTTQGGELILYAVWRPDSFQVTLNPNGGELNGADQSVTATLRYGETCATLPTPTKYGYDFVGWNSKEDGKGIPVGTNTLADKVVAYRTLYAQWRAKKIIVSFDTNQGSGSSVPDSVNAITVTYGSTYANLPTTGRVGYDFDGWYTEATGGTKVEKTTGVTRENHTLYAHWTAIKYEVGFDAVGGKFSDNNNFKSIYHDYDGTYKLPEEPARTGYTFLGWYTDRSGGTKVENTTQVTTAKYHVLCAHWVANEYTVTFDAQGGTFPNDGSKTQTMNLEYYRTYSVPQQNPTKSGYVFEGWYTERTGGTQVTTQIRMTAAENHTLYARWRQIKETTVTVGEVTLTFEGTPVYAKTDSEGKVTKGGSSSDYNIMLEEGELTLKNATVYSSTDPDGAIHTTNALVIKLEGKNTVTSAKSDYGIRVASNKLNIQGNGSLEVTAGTGGNFSDAIYVGSDIVIDGATVTATGREASLQSRGILCSTKVIIRNGAKVTAAGGTASKSYGIWCRGGITIDNSSCTATGSTRAITMETSGELKLINAHLASGSENGTSAEWIPQN